MSVVKKISLIFFIIILGFTFFSKTINNFLLPSVKTTKLILESRLTNDIETTGYLEFDNKNEIYTYKACKVKSVNVKENQDVNKGEILATVDVNEYLLELKNLELEIFNLKKDIENCIEDKDSTKDYSQYNRNIELALRNKLKAIDELNNIEKLYKLGARTKEEYEEAKNDVDNANYEYEKRKRNLDKIKEDDTKQYNQLIDLIEEKKLELELKELIYKNISNQMPKNGEIISPINGIVLNVNAVENKMTDVSCPLFIIVPNKNECIINWNLKENQNDYLSTSKITAKIHGKIITKTDKEMSQVTKDKEFNVTIDKSKFNAQNKSYEVCSNVKLGDLQGVNEGQLVQVNLSNSKTYHCIVPISSLAKNKDNEDCIFVINSRRGFFGTEYYVEEKVTKILSKSDYYCAIDYIESDEKEKIIIETNKPLEDGVQVKLR